MSESGTRNERREIGAGQFNRYYSLARTCEIAMQDPIGQPYETIVYLANEAIG